MSALVALAFKIVGVGFLIVAAVGVVRFTDAFQRMHAATKAGTLGAGLVVVGTIISHGSADAAMMGTLTIAFLLMTVPVAGHMLGRASYISGAPMAGLKGENALEHVLERQEHSLEDRLADLVAPAVLPGKVPEKSLEGSRQDQEWYEDISEIKLAIIHGHVEEVFARARSIADANRAHISAQVIVDHKAIESARDARRTRSDIRQRAARAMEELETLKGKHRIRFEVVYQEGEPFDILASEDRALLVLPREGWFHHGNDDPRPGTSWAPDGLLNLPHCHKGPVLYAGKRSGTSGKILIRYDGETHLPSALDWALSSSLWPARHVVVLGKMEEAARATFVRICNRHEVSFEFDGASATENDSMSLTHRDADAIVLGRSPRPLRTRWYGQAWYDRLLPGYEGDILIVCQ